MAALAIVERLNVVKNGLRGLDLGLIALAVGTFAFERSKEALGRSIKLDPCGESRKESKTWEPKSPIAV